MSNETETTHAERLERPRVEALDRILGQPLKVLDDGFVRVVDYMGADESIVQAARVSYGKGTKKVQEDRGLIRYLLRHRHTTPFEMCEIKLHVRVPMDCWRQWIRHRSACLAEGTDIYFDLPEGIRKRGARLHKSKIEDLWARFQQTENRSRPERQGYPYFRRDRVRSQHLRQVNEDSLKIQYTRIVNVYKNGIKPVYRVTLEDGKQIEATADHRFLFEDGWHTLAGKTGLYGRNGIAYWREGDYRLYVNGQDVEVPRLYQDADWLNRQYNVEARRIADIAQDCGVSYQTIRKWLREHGIQHARGGRSKKPWNRGRRYRLGSRVVTGEWRAANREARAGQASNFWKGGVSSDRESIGRWTSQTASRVHARFGWTCQLCHKRTSDLECHHIVPVWADPTRARDESNLVSLCAACHRGIQGREMEYVAKFNGPPVLTEWKKRPRAAWNRLTVARLGRIASIEYAGEKMTYDLEVEGPHHNFVANGIVTHNSVNEYSTRYSIAIDAAQATPPDEWRAQSTGNRQGSAGVLDAATGASLSQEEADLHRESRRIYEARLAKGVAREQARKDLPLSTYTEAYWKIDLHNLLHFLALRMEDHSQLEIRSYAKRIGEDIVAKWVPFTWEAFIDYRVNSLALSSIEREVVRAVAGGDHAGARRIVEGRGWLEPASAGGWKKNREREELEAKLADFNLPVPWA
jgi:thymidylate synthase (FAD)